MSGETERRGSSRRPSEDEPLTGVILTDPPASNATTSEAGARVAAFPLPLRTACGFVALVAVSPCAYVVFGGWPNLLVIWAWAAFAVNLRSLRRREAKLALPLGGLFAALVAGILLLRPEVATYYLLAALLTSEVWSGFGLADVIFGPLVRRLKREE